MTKHATQSRKRKCSGALSSLFEAQRMARAPTAMVDRLSWVAFPLVESRAG
jgi:hypothetical protein